MKAQHARAFGIGLVADVARGPDPQEEVAVGHWQDPVVLMPIDRQAADYCAAARERAVVELIAADAAADREVEIVISPGEAKRDRQTGK